MILAKFAMVLVPLKLYACFVAAKKCLSSDVEDGTNELPVSTDYVPLNFTQPPPHLFMHA